jgi:hypothetical protein
MDAAAAESEITNRVNANLDEVHTAGFNDGIAYGKLIATCESHGIVVDSDDDTTSLSHKLADKLTELATNPQKKTVLVDGEADGSQVSAYQNFAKAAQSARSKYTPQGSKAERKTSVG